MTINVWFDASTRDGPDTGTVISPAVRLSPKARNLVRDNSGIGAVTDTVNVQARMVEAPSVAVHCTGVSPTGNSAPDVCVQLTRTGATPPVVVGGLKVTATGAP